ncbi:fimbrial protein [Kalamiella sp. sgz302252]|uniref:fimbrial protein n=1 Tax=Pantoea sp. sgz302252 TaxID=3341827 RepID=UPI0036D31DE8
MDNLKKQARLLLWGLIIAGLGQQAQAETGMCTPLSGTPQRYTFTFDARLETPEENKTGQIISNASKENWGYSNTYQLKCDCNGVIGESYISAYSPLPILGKQTSEGGEYYQLNEYLAISAKVFVLNNDMVPIPFTNVNNKRYALQKSCKNSAGHTFESGSRGSVDLYFIRPFVGVTTIPLTKLVEVHIATENGVVTPEAAAEVYMSGTVTVPQSCVINPDESQITVDFGDIFSTDFKTAGAKPDSVNIINKQLTLKCSNISEGVIVSLSFQGNQDPSFSDALKTTNSDIAIRMVDKNSNIITPNSGLLGVDFDYPSNEGSTEINFYPISTSGEAPEVGEFEAHATIRAEIN